MSLNIKSFTADDGVRIKYIDEGAGVPVVYVLGLGTDMETWSYHLNYMKERCRIISFDTRGHGYTEAYGEISVERCAKDLNGLLNHLGIEKFNITGYSMGAIITWSYIQQYGCDHINKVIFNDMTPKFINEDGWNLGVNQGHYTREWFERDIQDALFGDFYRFSVPCNYQGMFTHTPDEVRDPDESLENIIAKAGVRCGNDPMIMTAMFNITVPAPEKMRLTMGKYWASIGKQDFRGLLKDISVPTGIIYAEPGSYYTPATAEYIAKKIPDATLMPIPNTTHMCGMENPELFLKYWCEFFEV